MKKLMNLKGAKTLNRKQQNDIYGGGHIGPPTPDGPCGETGGNQVAAHYCYFVPGAIFDSNGQCWICN